jgi:hypothetical protein
MAKGKAQKTASRHVEQAQIPVDAPAEQLKQLQTLFTRFKDVASKKRAKVWAAFEEHVRQHGESPSTRSFKARCLLLELDEEFNERDRPNKVAAFREYMHATYLDGQGPPHSISAMCLFAHFLNNECAGRDYSAHTQTLRTFLDNAVSLAKLHGTRLVDPSLEVMEATPTLRWEKCHDQDPRLQILHRLRWLCAVREGVGRADEAISHRGNPGSLVEQPLDPDLQNNRDGVQTATVRLHPAPQRVQCLSDMAPALRRRARLLHCTN